MVIVVQEGMNIKQDLRRAQSSEAENKQTSVFGLECCEACARIRCFKCIFRRNRSTNIRLYVASQLLIEQLDFFLRIIFSPK